MRLVRIASIGAVLLLAPFTVGQTTTRSNVWEPFMFFVGAWEGTGSGEPRTSTIQREYRFTLNNRFLHVQNKSIYPPQPKNPKGEVHEDWGMISFDKSRKQFVFRQFHVEGFVNQYVSNNPDGKTIVFTSESIENIPAGYRARETYRIINSNEFEEVFEMAEPNKDFAIYSQGHFKRKQ